MADDVTRPADEEVEAHGGLTVEDAVEDSSVEAQDEEPDVEAHGGLVVEDSAVEDSAVE